MPLLSVNRICKSFGAVTALQDVSISFNSGEVHAVCGENGAGKSTLVKILMGIERPDSGSITLNGEIASIRSPQDAQTLGLAQVAQELSIVPELSVLDNIWLGSALVPFIHRRRGLRRRAHDALTRLGVGHYDLDCPAGALTIGECQMVEIARLLVRDARLLILDEPTATLSDAEIANIFAAIRALRAEGRSIIYITHRLGEVFNLCDAVSVMRNGRHIATKPVGEFDRNSLIEVMLGRSFEEMYLTPRVGSTESPTVLDVKGLTAPGFVEDFSMAVPRGRLVCIAGQVGSGAHHVLRALAGLSMATGNVSVDGRPLPLNSAALAQARNIHFISEDRASEGIFPRMQVVDNVVATRLPSLSRLGFLSWSRLRRVAARLVERIGVDKKRLRSNIGDLSGGNQQKVLFGRAMEQPAAVLLMNEPTRGVDVGARAEIYRLMRAFCNEGFGLVMTSTDLEEIIGVADIVLTMYRGRLVGRYAGDAITMKAIVADITHPTGTTHEPGMRMDALVG
jgi:ribose transport system ATP-binding protein/rhamnose transport system ATP-binding protein